MVLLIIIPFLNGYFIGGIHHFQTYPYRENDEPMENYRGLSLSYFQRKPHGFVWHKDTLLIFINYIWR